MKILLSLLVGFLGPVGCSSRIKTVNRSFSPTNQYDPSISGDGKHLAFITDKNGKPTVQIRDVKTGTILRLRHFYRHQPHSSPSLSWSGRYLAVITQRNNERVVVIEDRLTGRFHQLLFLSGKSPLRVSLSSDASQIAIQLLKKGKKRVVIFDLSTKIDPDFVQRNQTSLKPLFISS